jgi:phosphoesterase RecJ-like protein
MMTSGIDAMLAFLVRHDAYLLVGHQEPDGDCVASQLVLASWLMKQGKQVGLLSAGPFTRTEIAPYAARFSGTIPEWCTPGLDCAVVVLDCSALSRIGPIATMLPADLPLAFIDHHAASGVCGEALFVDSTAPAVAFMIQQLLERAGHRLDHSEAGLLLFGLCTDTGFFRHLDEHSATVFHAAARLIAAGASPKQVFKDMNDGKPLLSRRLMGQLLSRVASYHDGKLLITWMDLHDQESYGLASRDSDMLYQLLMTVAGMEVAVVIRQETPGACTVGFRSKSAIDVASIAALFGGGGHRLAAGLHLDGTVQDMLPRIVQAFDSVFGVVDGL